LSETDRQTAGQFMGGPSVEICCARVWPALRLRGRQTTLSVNYTTTKHSNSVRLVLASLPYSSICK